MIVCHTAAPEPYHRLLENDPSPLSQKADQYIF